MDGWLATGGVAAQTREVETQMAQKTVATPVAKCSGATFQVANVPQASGLQVDENADANPEGRRHDRKPEACATTAIGADPYVKLAERCGPVCQPATVKV